MVVYVPAYTFVLKHHARIENKVADALSHRALLLNVVSTKIIGFERLRDEYATCPDFSEIYQTLS